MITKIIIGEILTLVLGIMIGYKLGTILDSRFLSKMEKLVDTLRKSRMDIYLKGLEHGMNIIKTEKGLPMEVSEEQEKYVIELCDLQFKDDPNYTAKVKRITNKKS